MNIVTRQSFLRSLKKVRTSADFNSACAACRRAFRGKIPQWYLDLVVNTRDLADHILIGKPLAN